MKACEWRYNSTNSSFFTGRGEGCELRAPSLQSSLSLSVRAGTKQRQIPEMCNLKSRTLAGFGDV